MDTNKDNSLEDSIRDIVSRAFSDKEEANQRKAMEEALTTSATTIENLTTSLETLQSELAAVNEATEAAKANSVEELAAKDAEIAELSKELETAKQKLEAAEAEKAELDAALKEVEAAKALEARLTELKTAKVEVSAESTTQIEKIKAFSDEEFANYKSERVALRAAVEAELAKNVTITDSAADASASDGDVVTPPADIDVHASTASAMNFENTHSDSVASKYAELGKAMASLMKDKSDK